MFDQIIDGLCECLLVAVFLIFIILITILVGA